MKDTPDQKTQDDTRVLGDINPEPGSRIGLPNRRQGTGSESTDEWDEDENAASGGSNHDRTKHVGSRDVTEGTTGGTGTEVGGTRNLRTGTGATGTDIGGEPE